MNKKFLSAILFGALMVTSTGTFVSCKDYDDDIDQINTTLTDLKSQIAALQNEVTNGNWVTSLTSVDGGFTVTFKNGSTYTIVNGKDGANGEKGEAGEPGKDGNGTIVEVKDGYWYIDGEKTEYVAVTDEDLNEVKVPYVNDDNMWVFFEDGKEVVSKYNANGAAYAVSTDGVWTLNIPDANGEMQSIKLPGEGAAITELELVGYYYGTANGFTPMADNSVYYNAYKPSATTNWKGNKPNLNGNEILVAYTMHNLVARVAPVNVDASNVEFSLVNSRGTKAPVTVSMSSFANDWTLTRTASVNGMYSVQFEATSVTSNSTAAAWAQNWYGTTANPVLFALKSSENMISKHDIAIVKNPNDLSINNFYVWTPWTETEVTTATTSLGAKEISLNSTYYVYTNNDPYLYDAYLSFNADQVNQWGIVYDKENAPTEFTVTKLPDNQTPAPIQVTFNYLTKEGSIKSFTFYVIPRTNLNGAVQLCDQIDHVLVKNIANVSENAVIVPLTKMIEALGTTGYTTWKNDARLSNISYSIAKTDWSGNIEDTYTVSFLDANKNATTDQNKAQYVKILFDNANAINLTKEYVATINFTGSTDKYLSGVINTVTIPVKFSIPAISEVLVKEAGVFINDGNTAYAYLNDFSTTGTDGKAVAKYALSNAFNKFADHISVAGLTFNTELGKITGTDTNASTVAAVNNSAAATVDVQLTDKTNGYKTDLDVSFTKLKYLNLYPYDDYKFVIRIMSPLREGKFEAKSGSIKISATGETNVTKADVWAYTYNNEVKYDIFKVAKYDAATKKYVSAWDRTDIASVKFSADNNVFGVVIDEPTDVVLEDAVTGEIKRESFITLNGKNLAAGQKAELTIIVTDKWGYELKLPVDVETTVTTD